MRKHKDHIWRGQIWQQDADEEEQERQTADRRQQASEVCNVATEEVGLCRHPMHRVSMHDSEWSHRHVTEAELHRLNRTVGADLKLTEAEVQAAMPVRPLPRPARRARAVSAAIGRFHHPPSTEVHSNRPLQLVPLLRTSRWRLMRVTTQHIDQLQRPHQPGSHAHAAVPMKPVRQT